MSLAGLVAILLALVAAASWRPLRRIRNTLGLTHLTGTGHAFLLLGFAISMVVSTDDMVSIVDGLIPIVAFVTGWIGFAVGIRFDVNVLRKVPLKAHMMGLAPATFAFVGVGSMALGLCLLLGLATEFAMATALIVGAAAASSGPTLAITLRQRPGSRRPEEVAKLRMIEFSAGLDDVIVIAAALLAFAWFRQNPQAPVYWYVILSLGAGTVLGVVTWLFLGGRASQDERLLLGLAMIVFAAGLGSWLELSPSGIGATAGFVLVNMPGQRMRLLMNVIHKVERPAVVILMTLVGFHLGGSLGLLLLGLLFAMTLWRGYLKYLGARLFDLSLPRSVGLATDKTWGWALVSQGSLGMVVALSFHHVWRNEASLAALSAIGIASVANEFASVPLLAKALRPPASGHSMQRGPRAEDAA